MFRSALAPALEPGDRAMAPGYTLIYRSGKGRAGLACWLALPTQPAADRPPLVAVHGIGRAARDQAALFAPRAAAAGRVVIAPIFDEERWPLYQQVVRQGRADLALLGLMTELRLTGIWRTPGFEFVGYSGGAQFAHRFAMLYPNLVVGLTTVSAGWYTFPDEAPFPYGLGARRGRRADWGPRLASGLDAFLRLPITVAVGAEDNRPDHLTRSGPAIDRQQGEDRVTRAIRWADALKQAAAARALTPRTRLRILPESDHDFRRCVERGGLDRLVLPDLETPSAADDRRAAGPA